MKESPRVRHGRITVDGVGTFYREAGRKDAPVLLLPHGYPCSSYEFREMMPRLADSYRLLAPDFPGHGYSDTPAGYDYSFDRFAVFLGKFATAMGADSFALYCHDFGGYIGLRLAIAEPTRIKSLIFQNADIYEDTFGPEYEGLKAYWANPTPEGKAKLGEAVSEAGFRREFLNHVGPELAARIPPDLWKLHWSMMTPERIALTTDILAGLRENLAWFPRFQDYLRRYRPPTLLMFGRHDSYIPEAAARSFLRVLPDAELHLLDAGHWPLETSLEEAVPILRDFLDRTMSGTRAEPALKRRAAG
jgi:pimeloyl-ACP methyl ester carboxylesterase